MKTFLEYLKLRAVDLCALAFVIYVFAEYLWTGEIYNLELGQMILIALIALFFCIVLVIQKKNLDRLSQNKDCLPKQK